MKNQIVIEKISGTFGARSEDSEDEDEPKQFNIVIGYRVLRLRKMYKLNQTELAYILGLKRPSITNIERGRQRLSLEAMLKLCRFFQIAPNDFLSWEDKG